MIFGLVSCLFWTLVIVVSATTLADPQKRVNGNGTTCDFQSMSFNEYVELHVGFDQIQMKDYLNMVLKESGMAIGGAPKVSSPFTDPNRLYCNFFATASDQVGVSLPRCLMETAITDFCTVNETTWIHSDSPHKSNKRGGRWTTHQFTDYSMTGLYVGIEVRQVDYCKDHQRGLYPQKDAPKQPDQHCRDMLMGMVVDTCEGSSQQLKFGGAKSDYCETWAVYPLPPSKNATGGATSVLTGTPGPTAYSLCAATTLAGDYPTSGTGTGTWVDPSTATIFPSSKRTSSQSTDVSTTMSTVKSSTTSANSTETTDGSTTTPSTTSATSAETTDGSTTASSTSSASSTETTGGSTTSGSGHRVKGRADAKRRT